MSSVEVQSAGSGDSGERIASAKQGCQQTRGELLEDAQPYLYGLARSAIDSDVQAKLSASDLVQETMIDAHRSFEKFNGENSRQLIAWLRRILINNLLNHYRCLRNTQKRNISREFDGLDVQDIALVDDETPSGAAVHHEEKAVLEQELARMSEHYRQLIELRHREQLSFVEIAKRLGKTPDAVRMTWYRAFDQLSKALEQRLS